MVVRVHGMDGLTVKQGRPEGEASNRGFDGAAFLRALASTLAGGESRPRTRYVVPRVHAKNTRPGERAKGNDNAQPV